jgi:hypothetical protein
VAVVRYCGSDHYFTLVRIMAEKPPMTLDRLKQFSKEDLAAFASPLLTQGWDGEGLVALLYDDENLREENDCIARIMAEFKATSRSDTADYGRCLFPKQLQRRLVSLSFSHHCIPSALIAFVGCFASLTC